MIDIQNRIRNINAVATALGEALRNPAPALRHKMGVHTDACERCGLTGLDMMIMKGEGIDVSICRPPPAVR